MLETIPLEVRVSVDIGCHQHSVAIGLSSGEVLEEFDIVHQAEGFAHFFSRLERYQHEYSCPVAVAMEGYNGYARPLDTMIRARDYRLYNINNLKLARFKEIFPAAAKTDALDARKGLELFQLRDHLPTAKDVLQEVAASPEENAILKRFTRRRRHLVREKGRVLNRLQGDLQAVCPGLLEMTNDAGNLWFLRFLTSRPELTQLARLRSNSLRKIKGVGATYTREIQAWQKHAVFSHEVDWVGDMIQADATRILELLSQIQALEAKIDAVAQESVIATILDSIPGFGRICSAELAGEIGTIERFRSDASLGVYIGMSNLDNSSGRIQGSKAPKHVNTRAKAAMMIAVDRHRKRVPESQRFYEKKRAEGKKHNQAIRALGRHLCRVIYKLLKEERAYKIRD
ncbi:MAG: IS110 family transposase [Candidatus Tectomicrobia bacterium]|nr:IS110 family transposase [Candidatus Tectomicrobia bacterium]